MKLSISNLILLSTEEHQLSPYLLDCLYTKAKKQNSKFKLKLRKFFGSRSKVIKQEAGLQKDRYRGTSGT